MTQLQNLICNPFLVDRRSLALTRIIFAILILTDLLIRFSDLSAHYTNAGVLPLDALFKHHWYIGHWSVHALSGSYFYQSILFFISAFSAVMLLIGWKTRVFTAISWFLLASLNTRNPLVLQAGDVLFRTLMFWAIFIPWGDRFSVDSFRSGRKQISDNTLFSAGALAFMLQVVFMYVFTALIKDHPVWNENFNAIYYALSMEQFTWLLGPVIYEYPGIMKVLTFSVFWIELLGPVLFFIPYKNSFFRSVGIILFLLLQSGLMLTMWLGLFPIISIASLLIFIPSVFWDRLTFPGKFLDSVFSGVTRYVNSLDRYMPDLNLTIPAGFRRYSLILTIFIIFMTLYVFFWNLTTLGKFPLEIPYGMNWIARTLRVDQKWNMFAPHPVTDDGWFVVIGQLENSGYVDVLNNRNFTDIVKPDDFKDQYKNYRWRKYLRNIMSGKNKEYRPYYGEYLCNRWNSVNPQTEHLHNIEVVYMQEKTLLNYRKENPQRKFIFKYVCGDKGPGI